MSRFIITLLVLSVALVGCSDSGSGRPGTGGSDTVVEERGVAAVATGGEASVTTTTSPEAIYASFVEAWNGVLETGSPAQIRMALHPESLHLYGAAACVEYIQSQDPIPDDFKVIWPSVPAEGFTQVELDGMRVTAYLDVPAVLEWPGGRFTARWAAPLVPDSELGRSGYGHHLVLVDCGDPLEGRIPLVLAAYESRADAETSPAATLPLDAPDRWWIEIAASDRGSPCDIALVDSETGDTELGYTAYEDTAAEVPIAGSLQIEASGTCPRIRAVTDESLLSTPVTDLEPGPASIWMPHLYADGEQGIGETIVVVNSGELPGDLTGWTLEGISFSYRFPDGFVIGPKQEVFVHARCGSDTERELHLCLDGNALGGPEMTLYDGEGMAIDGFG